MDGTSSYVDLSSLLGLDALAPEEQEAFLARLGDMVLQTSLLDLASSLTDEEAINLEEFLSQESDPARILQHLIDTHPNFIPLIQNAANELQRDSLTVAQGIASVTGEIVPEPVAVPTSDASAAVAADQVPVEPVAITPVVSPTPTVPAEPTVVPGASTRPAPTFAPNPTAQEPVPASVDSASTPQAAPEPPVPPMPVSPAQVSVEPAAAVESIVETVAAANPEPPAPVTDSGSASTSAAPEAFRATHLARIKEIKRLVNEQVGNPVNLIDAENDIGRGYMNALLEAMKILNAGSEAEIEAKMQDLETAYAAVVSMLEGGVTEKTAPATVPVEDSAVPTVEPEAAAVTSTTVTNEAIGYSAQADTVTTDPVSAIPPTPAPSEPVVPPAPAVSIPAEEPPAAPVTSAASVVPDAPAASPIPTPAAVTDAPPAATSPAASEPPVPPAPTPQSVSDTLLPDASTIPSMLATPEIENGLNQLLGQWEIFKSSGFLGTGPSGSEHPLYLQLKDTPMGSVVAGRYDGSTPEVKQAISDYMKGWRYEQDVTHTQGETFEHYLRRVVKAILDNVAKQNQSA